MDNWKILSEEKRNEVWNFVYDTFKFNPNKKEKSLINFDNQDVTYDISMYYDKGFDEDVYTNFHLMMSNFFIKTSNGETMYALDWRHNCFEFNPLLPFEKDEFGEWLIPAFPNGDYLFFLLKDLKSGVFADGINLKVSFFGEKILKTLDNFNPILSSAINARRLKQFCLLILNFDKEGEFSSDKLPFDRIRGMLW